MTAAEAIRIINTGKSYIGQADSECSINLTIAQRDQIAALIQHQADEIQRLNRLFTKLTPGGSEFVNSPENCIEWVNERKQGMHDAIVMFSTRCKALEDDNKRLQAENAGLRCCGNCENLGGWDNTWCVEAKKTTANSNKCDKWRRAR